MALPKSNHDWQSYFQRARDPLFLLNSQRRILLVNAAWENLTGLSLDQAFGLFCSRRLSAEPHNPLARLLAPPADALEGRAMHVRRAGPGRGAWDINFQPFSSRKGKLRILGRIQVVRDHAVASVPIPESLMQLRERLEQRFALDRVVAESEGMKRALEKLRLARTLPSPVLFVGEVGAGKRFLGQVLHHQGTKAALAFVALRGDALPPLTVADQLFGEVGLLRRDDVGTVYLHEPGRMPHDLQMKIVEYLERADSPGPRLLAGMSNDSRLEVSAGLMLESLERRLSVWEIQVPPLRERVADLPRLADHLLDSMVSLKDESIAGLTAAAWEIVKHYAWPGNAAELQEVLRFALLRTSRDRIDAGDLPARIRLADSMDRVRGEAPPAPLHLDAILEQVERRLLERALRAAQGNKSKAAEHLSIWRDRLIRRIKALGIDDKPPA